MSTGTPDTVSETLDPGSALALARMLDDEEPDLSSGLPPLWHWIYLLDRPKQSDLGTDGHPQRCSVQAPPGPGLRRMWAGGRVRSLLPLKMDARATRTSEVVAERRKEGRSGPLLLRTVRHQVTQDGRIAVEEEQDIVYLPTSETRSRGPAPASSVAETQVSPDAHRVEITPTLLFRFSALTYNAHRIHYDRDYARDVEGYPGLLVHGPLQALLMAEAARRVHAALPRDPTLFSYRLVAPLFDHQGCQVSALPDGAAGNVSTVIRDRTGRVTATGTYSGV